MQLCHAVWQLCHAVRQLCHTLYQLDDARVRLYDDDYFPNDHHCQLNVANDKLNHQRDHLYNVKLSLNDHRDHINDDLSKLCHADW